MLQGLLLFPFIVVLFFARRFLSLTAAIFFADIASDNDLKVKKDLE
jgi:hypothetical protein